MLSVKVCLLGLVIFIASSNGNPLNNHHHDRSNNDSESRIDDSEESGESSIESRFGYHRKDRTHNFKHNFPANDFHPGYKPHYDHFEGHREFPEHFGPALGQTFKPQRGFHHAFSQPHLHCDHHSRNGHFGHGGDDSNDINKVEENNFVTDIPTKKPKVTESSRSRTRVTQKAATTTTTTTTTEVPKIDLRSGFDNE